MSKNKWKKWVSVVGRLLLAYALVFAQGAWATQNQGTKDKAASPQKAAAQQANEKLPSVATRAKSQTAQAQSEESESAVAEEKPSHDGSHEGIKVHGHWTIEIRNPDGSLVTHREFENSLIDAGGNFLVSVLARNKSVSGWWVNVYQATVYPTPAGGPCNGSGAVTNTFCTIAEPNILPPAPNVFTNPPLSVTPTSTSKGLQLVLSGSATAAVSNAIDTVDTNVAGCNPTVAPSPLCTAFTETLVFTSHTLSPPLNVSGGQTIAVTVVISFS